jgi:hypothetical protein
MAIHACQKQIVGSLLSFSLHISIHDTLVIRNQGKSIEKYAQG